jgi:hypothetical protein
LETKETLERLRAQAQKQDELLTAAKQKLTEAELEKLNVDQQSKESEEKLSCLRAQCDQIAARKCKAQEALFSA